MINEKVYAEPDVVEAYARTQGLTEAEQRMLYPLGALRDERLLDIGVGAGRTTEPLRARCRRYVGIDYSWEMVDAALERFPGADIRVMDARHLEFPDHSFDVVLFSYNGLDYVDMTDRRRILGEIHRVLVPGGLLVFCSHNRHYRYLGTPPWLKPWTRQTLSRTLSYLRHSSRRHVVGQYLQPHWARVVDDAHDYRLLTTYVTAAEQVRELRDAGFCEIEVFGQQGTVPTTRDSVWNYYRCRA